MSEVELGRELLKQLLSVRDQKGEVSLQDVSDIFARVAGFELTSSATSGERTMQEEISRLASDIDSAKKEIFAISTNEKSSGAINDASLHLDAVIKATEEASNTIMDAADIIQNTVGGVGGEKEQQIMDATTRIYEACNFQDISGQRLTKVIRLLTDIENRIKRLNSLFGAPKVVATAAAANAKPSDQDLLNGPQLKATSQADIDAMFNTGT